MAEIDEDEFARNFQRLRLQRGQEEKERLEKADVEVAETAVEMTAVVSEQDAKAGDVTAGRAPNQHFYRDIRGFVPIVSYKVAEREDTIYRAKWVARIGLLLVLVGTLVMIIVFMVHRRQQMEDYTEQETNTTVMFLSFKGSLELWND
ncbi:hypothetical protein DIPPA_56030, partial [Diplonema papillatum]